jgi:hypothetical protein
MVDDARQAKEDETEGSRGRRGIKPYPCHRIPKQHIKYLIARRHVTQGRWDGQK